jgi:hypothetical protein
MAHKKASGLAIFESGCGFVPDFRRVGSLAALFSWKIAWGISLPRKYAKWLIPKPAKMPLSKNDEEHYTLMDGPALNIIADPTNMGGMT